MGKILVVANWKMNPKSLKEAKVLFNKVRNTQAVICPPFIYISALKANGAQDCFWEEKGAFTGEISPTMLKGLGVEYIILGHSERRKYLGETEEMIDKKIKACLTAGLKPILCVAAPQGGASLAPKERENIIIAFEPISAVGTGKSFSVQEAKKIRESLSRFKTVLYGGSVNSQNADGYIKKAGFQGFLVGSASLNAEEFVKIAELS